MFYYLIPLITLFTITSSTQAGFSIETLSAEEGEIERDFPLEPLLKEEEELSAAPQKGLRPQVVQIPTKTSFSP